MNVAFFFRNSVEVSGIVNVIYARNMSFVPITSSVLWVKIIWCPVICYLFALWAWFPDSRSLKFRIVQFPISWRQKLVRFRQSAQIKAKFVADGSYIFTFLWASASCADCQCCYFTKTTPENSFDFSGKLTDFFGEKLYQEIWLLRVSEHIHECKTFKQLGLKCYLVE